MGLVSLVARFFGIAVADSFVPFAGALALMVDRAVMARRASGLSRAGSGFLALGYGLAAVSIILLWMNGAWRQAGGVTIGMAVVAWIAGAIALFRAAELRKATPSAPGT